jgi:hypothetical protein
MPEFFKNKWLLVTIFLCFTALSYTSLEMLNLNEVIIAGLIILNSFIVADFLLKKLAHLAKEDNTVIKKDISFGLLIAAVLISLSVLTIYMIILNFPEPLQGKILSALFSKELVFISCGIFGILITIFRVEEFYNRP